MTAQEYAEWYAAQSERTVADLRDRLDLAIAPCDCGHAECRGWSMIGRSSAEALVRDDLIEIGGAS